MPGSLTRPNRQRLVAHLAPPQEFPRDLDLHRLASQRPLQTGDLAPPLVCLGALPAALQALGAGREELLRATS